MNYASMCITHYPIILHLISVEGEIEQESKMKSRAYFHKSYICKICSFPWSPIADS